jgi:hypothetical protein
MLTKRTWLFIGVVLTVLVVLWLVLARNCPTVGLALTNNARNLHRLKNRTVAPQESEFDSRVTLDALLQPGNDNARWSPDRAGRIQGYVVDVAYARPEATNCYSLCRRDIHIVLAKRKDAPKREQVVVEVTPNFRKPEWTEKNLQAQLVDHWCEFEGWLYFDAGHEDAAENSAPNDPNNWRATSWEIHPVTKITVVK